MRPPAASRVELERLLRDDVPYGDLTTEALGIGDAPAVMMFRARGPMTVALVEDAAAIIEIAGGRVELVAISGDALAPGALILKARGPADALHRAWKVAQTLIEIWSGVATSAREIVDAARSASPHVAVACTRKHTPGAKTFAAAAIKAGGATMHRLGLSDTILVFSQHVAFLEERSLEQMVECLRQEAPEKKLVMEVADVERGLAAAVAGFDVIQAEKFAPGEVARLIDRLGPRRPVVAAAGGVNPSNAGDYARAGADVLVTSAPYTAPPRDVEVTIAPL